MKILRLNNETMRASLVNVYNHPKRRLAYAQGSARILENGNVFVGWGGIPEWSEFTRTGTLLSHSRALSESQEKLENYRSLKFHWVGQPLTKPKLLAYCRTCQISAGEDTDEDGKIDTGSPLLAYVSWNGATEVKTWRFYVSVIGEYGPWVLAGSFPKTGFETRVHLKSLAIDRLQFASHVSVEALDEDGRILAAVTNRTWVPRPRLLDRCDNEGCNKPERFIYRDVFSQSSECGQSAFRFAPAVVILILVIILIESANHYCFHQYLQNMVQYGIDIGGKGVIPDSFGSGEVKEV